VTASIIFAVSSMFSAGLNDLLFKQYVSKDRPTGMYIALIGLCGQTSILPSVTIQRT